MKNIINNKVARTALMEEGDIKKTLLILSIPTIIATLISAIYNFVDTLFVGMLNDTAAMGAVSVAFPLFIIISAIGQMLGIGAASYVSRSLGEKNKNQADKTASTALFISIIISIAVTIFSLIFLEPILTLVGATDTVMSAALDYMKWIVIGSIFTITNMTLNNIIRAEGNSRYSMNALIIGAVLNIIFDPIFMFTFNLGIKGAAIATVLGQSISTIYLLSYYLKKNSYVSIEKKYISKDKDIYGEIFKIGIPVFAMQFLASIAFGFQNSAASHYGDSALAAIGITLRIFMIPFFIIMGYIQGFQPFAAYNYGAKNYDRIKKALRISTIWLTSFAALFFALFQMFPGSFIRLFTKNPEVIALGINSLKGISLFMPILGFTMIRTSLFQALGKGKQAGILAIGRQGLFFLPSLLILPKLFEKHMDSLNFITNLLPNKMEPGLYGIMLAQALSDILTFILSAILAIFLNKALNENNMVRK